MPARLENEMKITASIEKLLKGLPPYVSIWHSKLYASKRTASSRIDFVRKVKRFLTSINPNVLEVKYSDITDAAVTNYYISIGVKTLPDGTKKETSDSYQQNVWIVLNNFLGFLAKNKYIEKNYMEDIIKPQNHDLPRIKNERIKLERSDFKRVLHKAELERDPVFRYRNSLILRLLMETGMRETALRIINISDIDFENKTLSTVDKGKGSGKSQTYPLSDGTIEAIKNWLQYRVYFEKYPSDALFLNYQGERLSCKGISRITDKYFFEVLGKHVRPHKVRGGVVSILYEKKGDIEYVRHVIGHANIATTQRYIKTDDDERLDALQYLAL